MRASVYIDGYNFYYGCIKGTRYRWLDFSKLCKILLPNDDITSIKYFTALVHPRPTDPEKLWRQQLYLRALKTIPNMEIILGSFLSHEVTMPRAPAGTGYAKVIKTQEKGSDVNLATHLLLDVFRDAYELAVIVSNDSDLLMPIRVVTEQFSRPVGLLNPQLHVSRTLLPHVMFVKNIRKSVLQNSQFPEQLEDTQGRFSKPPAW
jgi:uncharacterized LabA/DUF88 family protein